MLRTSFSKCMISAAAGIALMMNSGHLAWAQEPAPAPPANPAPTKRAPNIILFLADDLSYRDLSCFGQTQFQTPNIDRLAREGRTFTNAYAGGPWCAPSRASLLTGMNSSHLAVLEKGADGRPTKFNPTLAEMLKPAGYATCVLGKWHMYEGGHETWGPVKKTRQEQRATEVPAQMPWHRGFDLCRIGYSFGLNPYFPHQLETGDTTEIPIPENANVDDDYMAKNYRTPAMYDAQGRFIDKAGTDATHLKYAEDLYRAEALKFIQDNRARPFFLYYATPLMHGPLAVKSLGEFKDKPASWTTSHKAWAGEAQEMDQSVGALMDEVRKQGLEQDTIILFAADNGYSAWGYFGRGNWVDDPVFKNKGPWNRGKFINTNGGVIIPFIAWGPGRVAPGSTERAIVLYDLMATFADLSHAPLPGPTDGASFAALLAGEDAKQPLRAAIAWGRQGNYGIKIPDDFADKQTPASSAAKTPTTREAGQYLPPATLLDERYFAQGFPGPTPGTYRVRLFDIQSDPGCGKDLSNANPALCARAIEVFNSLEGPAKTVEPAK